MRGKGLLIGAELTDAYKDRAKDVAQAAAANGVIMLIAGPNVLRFAPSLIMPMADLDEGFARIDEGDRRAWSAKPLERRADARQRSVNDTGTDDAIRPTGKTLRSRRARTDGARGASRAALAAARPARARNARRAVRRLVSRGSRFPGRGVLSLRARRFGDAASCIGTSSIVASAGYSEPFYAFRNDALIHASRELQGEPQDPRAHDVA